MENLSEMPHFQIDFSDIAIVIPTLNRPEKAASRAEFWSKKGCQVIVAEGALHSEISLDPSILHVRSDNSFANRILEALSLTDAGLVALHPDDDFFSPRGLLFAAQELADTGISHGFCYGKTWEWVKSKNGDKLFPMYEASRTRRYSKKLYSLHFGSEGRFKFVPKVKYETCMLLGFIGEKHLSKTVKSFVNTNQNVTGVLKSLTHFFCYSKIVLGIFLRHFGSETLPCHQFPQMVILGIDE
jgi:hypothetical protein